MIARRSLEAARRPTLSRSGGEKSRRRSLGRQRGSAYLLALVALVLLTGLGLAVSQMAQTERLLGGGEAALADALAGAESGLELAATRMVLAESAAPLELLMNRRTASAGTESAVRVTASAPVAARLHPCNLCELNPADEGARIYRVEYVVEAGGERIVWRAGGEADEGERRAVRAVDGMFALQPWIVGELAADGTR